METWICSKFTWDTKWTSKLNINSLKINFNGIVLVIHEKMLRHFWRIAIVTRVLPNRDSEIRGAIVRIVKTNTILKRPVNSLFGVENIYHDNNQTDKSSQGEIASLFSLLSCESWIFMKENPDRKKSEFCFKTTKNRVSEYDRERES